MRQHCWLSGAPAWRQRPLPAGRTTVSCARKSRRKCGRRLAGGSVRSWRRCSACGKRAPPLQLASGRISHRCCHSTLLQLTLNPFLLVLHKPKLSAWTTDRQCAFHYLQLRSLHLAFYAWISMLLPAPRTGGRPLAQPQPGGLLRHLATVAGAAGDLPGRPAAGDAALALPGGGRRV